MEKGGPLVTICVPAFNAEPYIERCLEHILCQTFGTIEALVLDDASKDETERLVEGFGDNRIRYIRNEKNLGWRENVRKGYRLCRGEFVTVCPVDDYIGRDFVEEALNAFHSHPEVGIWACGARFVDVTGAVLRERPRANLGLIGAREFFRQTYTMTDVSPPSETMIRASCLKEARATASYDGVMYRQYPEVSVYLNIALWGHSAFHTDRILCDRTVRSDSLTGRFERSAFVLEDDYNVLENFSGSAFSDKQLVEEGNAVVKRKVMRNLVSNLAHLKMHEACKTAIVLLRRDYELRTAPLTRRIWYLVAFFGLVVTEIVRKAIGKVTSRAGAV